MPVDLYKIVCTQISLTFYKHILFRVNPVFGPDIDGLVIWFANTLKTNKTLKCVLC